MTEEEKKSGTISMKISTVIHEELKKIADATGKSLHQVTEEVFFAKLAIKKELDGAIQKDDEKCSVFELAIKYKLDTLKQLTAAAGLKYKLVQIEKLNKPDRIEYINKFCCPACNATFETQYACMSHFNKEHEQHHEQDVQQVFVCPFCISERLCSTKAMLQAHVLTEHKDRFNPPPSPIQRPIPYRPEIVIQKEEVRVYSCWCGYTCKSQHELGVHFCKCEKIKTIAGRVSA